MERKTRHRFVAHDPRKKMNFKKRLLISLGSTITLFAVLGGALIFFGLEITKKTETIKEINSETARRIYAANALSSMRREFEAIAPVRAEIENILPKRDTLLGLRSDLEAIGKNHRVNVGVLINGETPRTETNLGHTEFTLALEGSGADIAAFIGEIEQGKYFIKITSFDMTTQGNLTKASVSGQVFSF